MYNKKLVLALLACVLVKPYSIRASEEKKEPRFTKEAPSNIMYSGTGNLSLIDGRGTVQVKPDDPTQKIRVFVVSEEISRRMKQGPVRFTIDVNGRMSYTFIN